MNYIHNHTHFSNLRMRDCIVKLEDSVSHAFKMGATASFITDHESLASSVKHIKEVNKIRKKGEKLLETSPDDSNALRMANFKAVLGNEIYITKEGMSAETWEKGDRFYHLILLAKDRIGWEQLNELSSRAWSRSFKRGITRVPTYLSDLEEIVSKNPGHLIVTTACLGNWLGEKILSFNRDKSEETKEHILQYILYMKNLFGSDFYLEIQPAEYEEQVIYNNWLKAFAQKTGVELVVATDNHYLEKKDFNIHKAYLNSQEDLKGERETEKFYKYTYFQTEKEVVDLLSLCTNLSIEDINAAINNTYVIESKCTNYSLNAETYLPVVSLRDEKWLDNINKYDYLEWFYRYSHSEHEMDRYFLYKIIRGMEEKQEKGWLTVDECLPRLEIELEHIWKISDKIHQRLGNYFNTMQEMLSKIWEVSLVGAGRGSGAAYLVNYLLDITQINPLKTPIPLDWWRFLHESRPELPDLDLDSESNKKEEIFNLLSDWFEEMGQVVTRISTFSTEKSKSALITAARGLGYETEVGMFLASLIPVDRGFPRMLSVCLDGNDDYEPVKEFISAMSDYPDVLEVALKIEGLIYAMSQHAAGMIIIKREEVYQRTSLVKGSNGVLAIAYSLDDAEGTLGLVKYDMLNIKALDAMRATLSLLSEYGYIDWQGSLKETYDKYLHPAVIEYENKKMWDLVKKNKILGCFQYDTSQGKQAISLIQPESLLDLAVGNSALRLMANEYHTELPLISFAKQKQDISIWYRDLARYNLNEDEIKILEEHLLPTYGMCIEQEVIMKMSMDSRISNFDMVEANKLRKIIGKKLLDQIDSMKNFFFEKGRANGTREQMLEYVWREAFMLSAGYGFNSAHSVSYSVIALQQINLNYFYPDIFWNTARLLVDSDSADLLELDLVESGEELDSDDEETKTKSMNYFKMASAIGSIRESGIVVEPPDINTSSFTFRPSVEENKIYFGLKGISRCGESLIHDIIQKRPFVSLDDFLDRIKVNKIQATMLIKAGAFDRFGDRREMLSSYISTQVEKKKNLTLQNANQLIELNLVPQELLHSVQVFRLTKHLKKFFKYDTVLLLQDQFLNFAEQVEYPYIKFDEKGNGYAVLAEWEKWYKVQMMPMKNWITRNKDELIEKVYSFEYAELYKKYGEGTRAKHEMDALSFYHSGHELEEGEYPDWLSSLGISNFFDLPEEPEVEREGTNFKMFKLTTIAGTCIGRDKQKKVVGFLTPEGFILLKIYRSQFVKYDKQIKQDGVIEPSWFSKGSKLLVQGYRSGEYFIPKAYKNSTIQPLTKIEAPGALRTKRLGE